MLAQTDVTVAVGVNAILGIVCAFLANSRGRSGIGWFFLGLFFQCFALIVLLLLPDLKAQEQKETAHRSELRRLKEQLKKERQVADERHVAHRARLDAHDRALGLDTSAAEQRLIDTGAAPPALPAAAPPPDFTGTTWFYAHQGRQRGPVPVDDLRQLWQSEQIDPDALVWRAGMSDWTPITEIPGLLPDADPS